MSLVRKADRLQSFTDLIEKLRIAFGALDEVVNDGRPLWWISMQRSLASLKDEGYPLDFVKACSADGLSTGSSVASIGATLPPLSEAVVRVSTGAGAHGQKALEVLLGRCTPTGPRRDFNRRLCDAVRRAISRVLCGTCTVLVGSHGWGVETILSDVDLVIMGCTDADHAEVLSKLQQRLQEAAPDDELVAEATFVLVGGFARVPVLTVALPEAGFSIDVCVNQLSSVKDTLFFRSLFCENSCLTALLRLVKYFTQVRRFPKCAEGGYPSLVWNRLAIKCFRELLAIDHQAERVRCEDPGIAGVFKVLRQFFRCYGLGLRDLPTGSEGCVTLSEEAPGSADRLASGVGLATLMLYQLELRRAAQLLGSLGPSASADEWAQTVQQVFEPLPKTAHVLRPCVEGKATAAACLDQIGLFVLPARTLPLSNAVPCVVLARLEPCPTLASFELRCIDGVDVISRKNCSAILPVALCCIRRDTDDQLMLQDPPRAVFPNGTGLLVHGTHFISMIDASRDCQGRLVISEEDKARFDVLNGLLEHYTRDPRCGMPWPSPVPRILRIPLQSSQERVEQFSELPIPSEYIVVD